MGMVATEVKLVPRHYQTVGTKWLREKGRGLLADDVGLGKTMTASNAATGRTLVVTPLYLVNQWGDFLREQYDGVSVSVATGLRVQREIALKQKADFYVMNYAMLASYSLPVADTYIFDESHHLRNRNATQSRAAFSLVKDMNKNVFMLSASPMWKSVEDIWMQLHILYPKIFTSFKEFLDLYCITSDTPYGIKVLRIKKRMREELQDVFDIVMLRRTYAECERELPATIENTVTIDFPKTLMEAYRKLKTRYRMEVAGETHLINSSGILHTLRQITAFEDKVDAAKEIVESAKVPAVVFCWYREHAKLLGKAITGSEVLTGEISAEERHRRALKSQSEKRTIVATISALGEGINLSKYRLVVFFEEHYPPGSNRQALGRVVRDRGDMANHEPVLVYYVHVRKTIDETIHKIAKGRDGSIMDVLDEALKDDGER